MLLQDILRTIEIGIIIVGLVGGYFKLLNHFTNKLKELEMEGIALRQDLKRVEKMDDEIMRKLEQICEEITELKVELQNKQNRP